ncbi:Rieske (2Fe-2S) protein [Kribbella sp. CA-294648]|uniref:Rieske (2Fe-2S) protein n=1 Tax=Kribbella sp. CA-294648 TaxID=3239948 RepID=UPI003D8B286B
MSDNTAELGRAIDTLRDRRAVLRGAAVVGLAGVSVPLLAACGDDGAAGGTPTTGGTSSAPTSAPASTPASSAPPSSGGGGAVLGPVSDVPVGGGKVFADKIVVTQPKAGEYKGFSAICTHKGCPVKTVENNTINCPCHGSKFSVEDGSVKAGPATSPLAPIQVTVQGGNILGPA